MLMPISINVHFLFQVYAPLLPEEKWGRGKGELGDDGISCEGVEIELDDFCKNHPGASMVLHPPKIFPTKTSGNICRSRASGNQKGKVHGKNTTFYNSSMPGTVREKLSSRKFPDI